MTKEYQDLDKSELIELLLQRDADIARQEKEIQSYCGAIHNEFHKREALEQQLYRLMNRSYAASFECDTGAITGKTSAPVKRVEVHDDDTVEVVIDYWPPRINKSLVTEAEVISQSHPSKDAREFASDVLKFLNS